VKALILAGGRGNRINEFSENRNKCMARLQGRPLLEHVLFRMAAEDLSELVVVVGYKATEIINHFGTRYRDRRIRYVLQKEQQGLVHAMGCAKEALEGDSFFLALGDEIMAGTRCGEMIRLFKEDSEIFGVCGVVKAEDHDQARKTYAVVTDNRDRISRLIEKPIRPVNDLQGTGHCIFNNRILDYIEITPFHHERREKELPDLVQCAVDDGKTVRTFLICDRYVNVNSAEDLAAAEPLLRAEGPDVARPDNAEG